MQRIIRLLREKNHYLEKFFALNEEELVSFSQGQFDNVENFYRSRDQILAIMKRIDEMLDVENNSGKNQKPTSEDRAAVESALKAKEQWVAAILHQDLKLLEIIEIEKTVIIRELQSTKKARKVLGAYGPGPNSGRLDEKA